MSNRRACLFLALTVSAASVARAQARPGVHLAGGFATELDAGSLAHGSWSIEASTVWPIGGRFALGVDAGWHRYDFLDQRTFETEPPEAAVVRDWHRENHAFHVGPTLRWTPTASALAPYLEAGIGVYGLREANRFETHRLSDGAPVPEFTRSDTRTVLAPGASVGAGMDYFPGNGRVGFGVAARFRIAGRPYDDTILGVGFATLTAGIALR